MLSRKGCRPATVALVFVLAYWSQQACADMWFAGGLQFRQDLQVLVDEGVLQERLIDGDSFVRSAITDAVNTASYRKLDAAGQAALSRVRARLDDEGLVRATWSTDDGIPFRSYASTPRAGTELTLGNTVSLGRFDFHFQGVFAPGSDAQPEGRLDGSYLGARFGNWYAWAGRVPQWWGPGWDGALLRSTNARPVASLGLERIHARPFRSDWLHWLGPWRFKAVIGRLEADRTVPRARLLGARFAFQPVPSLTLGLARGALWGGEGRPETASSFWNLLIGNDNRGRARLGDTITKSNEPGDQLAGGDMRWQFAAYSAFYLQLIGEDFHGLFPIKYMQQAGIEHWGRWSALNGNYHVFVEATTTSRNQDRMYNHAIYRAGYRYHDLSLGYWADSDSRVWAGGASYLADSGLYANLLVREFDLNVDGQGINPLAPAGARGYEVRSSVGYRAGSLSAELGIGESRLTDLAGDNAERNRYLWTGVELDF